MQSIIECYRVFLAHLLGPIFGLVLLTRKKVFYSKTKRIPFLAFFKKILWEILFKGVCGQLPNV